MSAIRGRREYKAFIERMKTQMIENQTPLRAALGDELDPPPVEGVLPKG
ncbi:MAG: hypothetical protein P8R42_15760 [Candidatus Binatia bacterium]|nr:hypothetical protein [Candidatus Binatia bacterium]